MKAKEYLLQIKKYDRIIENAMQEIARYRNMAVYAGLAQDNTKVQTSKGSDRIGNAVSGYIDLERKLDLTIKKAYEAREDIIHTLEQLREKEYAVLYNIYVLSMNLYDVADACDKSYSWATSMHKKALDNLQRILDNIL